MTLGCISNTQRVPLPGLGLVVYKMSLANPFSYAIRVPGARPPLNHLARAACPAPGHASGAGSSWAEVLIPVPLTESSAQATPAHPHTAPLTGTSLSPFYRPGSPVTRFVPESANSRAQGRGLATEPALEGLSATEADHTPWDQRGTSQGGGDVSES